jgi:hypothetical protein
MAEEEVIEPARRVRSVHYQTGDKADWKPAISDDEERAIQLVENDLHQSHKQVGPRVRLVPHCPALTKSFSSHRPIADSPSYGCLSSPSA